MTFRLFCAVALVPLVVPLQAQQETPPYRNPQLAIEDRVSDLVPRMTLEEKVDQITAGRHENTGIVDTTGQFAPEKMSDALKGSRQLDSHMSPHDRAVLHNALQRYLLEKTRLGIPALFQGEALHGFMSYQSTSFPQALGLAATWDPALVKEVFTAAGDEMASAGHNQAFSPVLDLARDPRWGRTEETYGEDPYLASRIGVSAL